MLLNKRGGMELSMGTVVIVVLSVSLLIFGMILIRNIMCSGLQISESVSAGVQDQVKSLFSTDTYGVHCMGEGGQDIKLGTGGNRKVLCYIKTDQSTTYDIVVTDVKALSGASTDTVKGWVTPGITTTDIAVPAGPEKEVDFMILNIPRSASTTTIRLTIQATDKTSGSKDTIYSTLYIVPTGFIKGSIC